MVIKDQLFPIAANGSFQPILEKRKFRVRATGEYRPPKKGEFFIAGPVPEAYLAPSDQIIPFYIGRLVEVREIRREIVIRDERFLFRKFFELSMMEA